VKGDVIHMMENQPDNVTIDNESYFKTQVNAVLKELNEGFGIPHEEVRTRLSKWVVTKVDSSGSHDPRGNR
jgi:hypothetical protein